MSALMTSSHALGNALQVSISAEHLLLELLCCLPDNDESSGVRKISSVGRTASHKAGVLLAFGGHCFRYRD